MDYYGRLHPLSFAGAAYVAAPPPNAAGAIRGIRGKASGFAERSAFARAPRDPLLGTTPAAQLEECKAAGGLYPALDPQVKFKKRFVLFTATARGWTLTIYKPGKEAVGAAAAAALARARSMRGDNDAVHPDNERFTALIAAGKCDVKAEAAIGDSAFMWRTFDLSDQGAFRVSKMDCFGGHVSSELSPYVLHFRLSDGRMMEMVGRDDEHLASWHRRLEAVVACERGVASALTALSALPVPNMTHRAFRVAELGVGKGHVYLCRLVCYPLTSEFVFEIEGALMAKKTDVDMSDPMNAVKEWQHRPRKRWRLLFGVTDDEPLPTEPNSVVVTAVEVTLSETAEPPNLNPANVEEVYRWGATRGSSAAEAEAMPTSFLLVTDVFPHGVPEEQAAYAAKWHRWLQQLHRAAVAARPYPELRDTNTALEEAERIGPSCPERRGGAPPSDSLKKKLSNLSSGGGSAGGGRDELTSNPSFTSGGRARSFASVRDDTEDLPRRESRRSRSRGQIDRKSSSKGRRSKKESAYNVDTSDLTSRVGLTPHGRKGETSQQRRQRLMHAISLLSAELQRLSVRNNRCNDEIRRVEAEIMSTGNVPAVRQEILNAIINGDPLPQDAGFGPPINGGLPVGAAGELSYYPTAPPRASSTMPLRSPSQTMMMPDRREPSFSFGDSYASPPLPRSTLNPPTTVRRSPGDTGRSPFAMLADIPTGTGAAPNGVGGFSGGANLDRFDTRPTISPFLLSKSSLPPAATAESTTAFRSPSANVPTEEPSRSSSAATASAAARPLDNSQKQLLTAVVGEICNRSGDKHADPSSGAQDSRL